MNGMETEMRPPYIKWVREEKEDREKTKEAGHFVPAAVDYAHVTRPGQKDTLVKEAGAFIKDSQEAARQGRLPQAWVEMYKNSYERWKQGSDASVDGTPIKGWPVLGAGSQEAIIRAGIFTVEDLAQFPDAELSRIGMGAQAYKQKAISWLMAANDVGKAAEQLADQAQKISQLEAIVAEQSKLISEWKKTQTVDKTPAKV